MDPLVALLAEEVNGYCQRGEYQQALELALEAQHRALEDIGEEHFDYAVCLLMLGCVYEALGRFKEAEPLYRQALALVRRTRGENNLAFATCLNNLASVYCFLGNYTDAEPLYRNALEIIRAVCGEADPCYASSLNNLAALYQRTAKYAEAEKLYRQAVEIDRESFGDDHPDYARELGNLANLYREVGDYAQAEPLYQQARTILLTSIGENHPHYATLLHNLAVFYSELGNHAAAEPLYRQVLRIRRAALGDQHPLLAKSLLCLATLNRERGNYDLALSLYRQGLDIDRKVLGENHLDYATDLNHVALLHLVMGFHVITHPGFRTPPGWSWLLLEFNRRQFGEDHPVYPEGLGGFFESCLGGPAEAEPFFQKALEFSCQAGEIKRKALGEQHPDYASQIQNQALVYHVLGNKGMAETLYREALAIWRETMGEESLHVATCLSGLSMVSAANGRYDEALGQLKRTTTIENRMIAQVFSISSEKQRMGYLGSTVGNFHAYLSLVHRHLIDSPAAVQSALDLVLQRKAIGTEVATAQRRAILAGHYPSLRPKLQELTALQFQIAQKLLEGPGPEHSASEKYQETLLRWNSQRDQLEAELARAIPEITQEQRSQAAERRAVALALPAGSVLVEFVRINWRDFHAVPAKGEQPWKPPRYLAFVLTSGEQDDVIMIDLGDAEAIDQLIAEFRATLIGESEQDGDRDMAKAKAPLPLPTDERRGRDLRGAVFDRLASVLRGRKRIYLAPDGDLTRLPFEVLPTDDGRRLIDDYCISYIGCGRDILRFQSHSTTRPADALVAADPDFDLNCRGQGSPLVAEATSGRQSRDLGQSDLSFQRLPGTRQEGEKIAELLKVRPWLQTEVLEKRLKQIRSPWILHLATHGFFLADQERRPQESGWIVSGEMGRFSGLQLENPLLRSGLALAGGNTWLQKRQLPPEAEDGLLTAEDVTGMDLLDTELVVLSACNTGLGEIRTGEGVFGLRRAFVLAGAKTLVMSLWKVPDEETRELMEDFYRRILAGEPRAEALRNAQLTMKAKYPHPYFWGAFICQGNPGPLPSRRGSFYSLAGTDKQGPISDPELKELIRTGKLTQTGKVSLDQTTWHEAAELKGAKWPSS